MTTTTVKMKSYMRPNLAVSSCDLGLEGLYNPEDEAKNKSFEMFDTRNPNLYRRRNPAYNGSKGNLLLLLRRKTKSKKTAAV
mmetsp:Transcript_14278/g.22742  ORF Transcript_14278/g.22742 Transcript_14278/m.22742 type:complete len:82 (-) Transcript_14278:189-434(-)